LTKINRIIFKLLDFSTAGKKATRSWLRPWRDVAFEPRFFYTKQKRKRKENDNESNFH